MTTNSESRESTSTRPTLRELVLYFLRLGALGFGGPIKRIYTGCSSGAISVFQMDDPDHYRKLEDFPVQKKVHSLAVDPETHRVYAPEQEADGKAVARMGVYEAVVDHR